jgi:hypothetical protein
LNTFKIKIFLLFSINVFAFSADNLNEIIARKAEIDKFVYNAPLFINDRSLKALKKLGKFKNEHIDKQQNPHDSTKIIEYRTLTFKGLIISGFIQDQIKLSIIQIIVTDSRWKILNGLNVGSSSERINKVLGEPTTDENNIKEYCGETECVNFQIKKNKIIKVELNYYSD